MSFEIFKNSEKARVGQIHTNHGSILTPAFLFCGTQGTLKPIDNLTLKTLNTPVLLCNTFHLYNHYDLIKSIGLHKFIGWNGPIFTDSGGYQIFSMGYGSVSDEIKGFKNSKSSLISLREEGVKIRYPRDGSLIDLTPEKSIEIQCNIGVDLVVSLDECTPFHQNYKDIKKSLHRSHRWELRSLNTFKKIKKKGQLLYGIIQGGIYEDLRQESIDFVCNNDFDAIAIGGSLGKTKKDMAKVIEFTTKNIWKKERPIHLLGIGDTIDILEGVNKGIDTFDCVSPTRYARHGVALYSNIQTNGEWLIKLRNASYKDDFTPLEDDCACSTCKNFTKAYLNYLIRVQEKIFSYLIGIHNIFARNKLMHNIRTAIMDNTWNDFYNQYTNYYYKKFPQDTIHGQELKP